MMLIISVLLKDAFQMVNFFPQDFPQGADVSGSPDTLEP
jgi:hypothetical protein